MNAKMVITVPIDKIPSEVNSLLYKVRNELEKAVEETSACLDNTNHLEVVNKIDEIRKKLSLIDMNFDDAYNVLLGYMKYESEKLIRKESSNDDKPAQ